MSNIDPCECIDIYNHENAMRRLINMLRDSQNSGCSDAGCENTPTGPPAPNCAEGYLMLMLGWVVVATLLFLLRPKNLRRIRGDEKPSPSSGDGSGAPPSGPAVH